MDNRSTRHEQCSYFLILYIVIRWAIAKDVASGLQYLHEETSHRIIHRDVKPANILLDDKFNARVADFGLARLVADREVDVVTDVMGTRGYLAPGTSRINQYPLLEETLSLLTHRFTFSIGTLIFYQFDCPTIQKMQPKTSGW